MADWPLGDPRRCAFAVFFKHGWWNQADSERNAKRHKNEIIKIANHRYEIGYEVNRRYCIARDDNRQHLGVPWYAWITARERSGGGRGG